MEREIISRETDWFKLYIFTNSCHVDTLDTSTYKCYPPNSDMLNYDLRVTKIKDTDYIVDGHRMGSHGPKITAPFIFLLRPNDTGQMIKSALDNWDHKELRKIRRKIDQVFRTDAESASRIVDYGDYLKNPSSHMLCPLLFSDKYCKKYDVYPVIKDTLFKRINNYSSYSNIFSFMMEEPDREFHLKKSGDSHILVGKKKNGDTTELQTVKETGHLDLLLEWGLPCIS